MIKTSHASNCSRVFKNYDLNCPRCIELKNGSTPRDGWQKAYYNDKRVKEQRFLNAIKTHNCVQSKCGPVCVAFDW